MFKSYSLYSSHSVRCSSVISSLRQPQNNIRYCITPKQCYLIFVFAGRMIWLQRWWVWRNWWKFYKQSVWSRKCSKVVFMNVLSGFGWSRSPFQFYHKHYLAWWRALWGGAGIWFENQSISIVFSLSSSLEWRGGFRVSNIPTLWPRPSVKLPFNVFFKSPNSFAMTAQSQTILS